MAARGKYIVLEGDEGAGKTAQLERVQKRLQSDGYKVEIVREPGGDPFAESLRQILKHAEYEIVPAAEMLAFSAARANMLTTVVKPLLDKGTWVLADRSYLSTLVYQGMGHGLDSPEFRQVVQYAISAAPPDLTVVIDVSLGTSQKRQAGRGLAADRFDLDEGFRRAINKGYRDFESSYQLVHVDGEGSFEEVESAILTAIRKL